MSADSAVDVVIIGGGPAGLTLAHELATTHDLSVVVYDREQQAGGIPRHSKHLGYGVRDLHLIFSGPAYAERLVNRAVKAGVVVHTGSSVTQVTSVEGTHEIRGVDGNGTFHMTATAVVLATGVRERPRTARVIPGSRVQGVYTTGELQQSVFIHHQSIGQRAVVLGAEHVSYSAVMTLAHAGVKTAALITPWRKHQTWRIAHLFARLRYRFTVKTNAYITDIIGSDRVTAVEVTYRNGQKELVACDVVVCSGDWIADHELAMRMGVEMSKESTGPAVDTAARTSRAGVFAIGNLVHPAIPADAVALNARAIADGVAHYVGYGKWGTGIDVAVSDPFSYVWPQRVVPNEMPANNRFILWAQDFARASQVVVRQGDRELARATVKPDGVIPARHLWIDGTWVTQVDPAGPRITISLLPSY